MASSQFYLLFWVVLGAVATGGTAFSQRLPPEEFAAGSKAERFDSSGLDTLQRIGQPEEYEVDKEEDVHGSSFYVSSSNDTAKHRRSIRATDDAFSNYAERWSETNKAKYAVCSNPPEKSKVKELHVYDCCYFGNGLKIQQSVGKQVWDDIVTTSTNDQRIFRFQHDNQGSTEYEFKISREYTIQESNSWSISAGVTASFGISASLGYPKFFGLGVEFNFGLDLSLNSERTETRSTQETINVDQTYKVLPGKRVEIDWVITEETVTMKWHVDVFLKGSIGVYWDPDRRWLKNRNPKICGHYDYAIPVYKLADGINWHQSGSDLRFRRDGLFVGTKATTYQLILRECDVNRPQDCTRARSSRVVYTSPIQGKVKVLPVTTSP